MTVQSLSRRLSAIIAVAACAASLAPTAQAAGYVARPLSPPGDVGHGCEAGGMNSAGQVTGGCFTVDEMYSVGFITEARGRKGRKLGLLGGTDSFGWDINADGVVVGEATLPGDQIYRAVFRRPGDKAPTPFGTLGGDIEYAVAINDKAQVLGVSVSASSPRRLWVSRLSDTRLVDIGNMGGFTIVPKAINNQGTIVGYGPSADHPSDNRAFYAKAPGYAFVDMGTLGGPRAVALAINDRGQIVGAANFDETRVSRAFITDADGATMRDLGTPAGLPSSAQGINRSGQVVGQYRRADQSLAAFICSGDCSDFADLNAVATGIPAGVTLTRPSAINNEGRIVAQGSDLRIYLLTPQ